MSVGGRDNNGNQAETSYTVAGNWSTALEQFGCHHVL